MGVKDLIRLVQKSCPDLIRVFPNRLADLKGKTLVIDATLLTQRMHFARIPYKHRHVLGWYRLVQNMKEAGVNAICVFDSTKGRHIAKRKEVERRRERRRLDEARLIMELERLGRLGRLKPILTQLEGRPVNEVQKLRDQVNASTSSVQEAHHENLSSKPITSSQIPVDALTATSRNAKIIEEHRSPFELQDPDETAVIETMEPKRRQRYKKRFARYSDLPQQDAPGSSCTNPNATTTIVTPDQPDRNIIFPVSNTYPAVADSRFDERIVKKPCGQPDSETTSEVVSNDDSSERFSDKFGPSRINDISRNTQSEQPELKFNLEIKDASDSDKAHEFNTSGLNATLIEEKPILGSGQKDLEDRWSSQATKAALREDDWKESLSEQPDFDFPSTGMALGEDHVLPADVDASLQLNELSAEACELRDLYCNYIATKFQFTAINPIPSSDSGIEEILEQSQVYNMSRNQVSLVAEEEQIWNKLLYVSGTSLDVNIDLATDLQNQLSSLELKSISMVEMFERRRPPDEETYNDCKVIIRAMGVPCLESPESVEGEAYAAALVRHGRADYVASEDTDVIIYEAPLLRGLGNRSQPLHEVNGAQVRVALQLQRKSFVDLALLCGTDFSRRIRSIGPNRALKLIRQFNSIENLLEDPKLAARLPASDYLEDIAQARLIFSAVPPMPDDGELEQGEFDSSGVQSLLDRYGLSRVANLDQADAGYTLGFGFDELNSSAYQETAFGSSLENEFEKFL